VPYLGPPDPIFSAAVIGEEHTLCKLGLSHSLPLVINAAQLSNGLYVRGVSLS
jgi:hypothetical protein